MAIIYEDTLKNHFKSGVLAPIYIICGDDAYLKNMYVDKIRKLTADKDDIFNYSKFGAECDLQEVYDAMSQLPVMADKKCIILCDYDFEHCSKTELDKLCLLAEDTCDTAVLVLLFDSVDIDIKKSSKFKKLVSAAEKGGGYAAVLNHRRPAELAKMLTEGAAKRGCVMESSAAKRLIENVGEDINTLVNELEKLCAYKPSGNITESDVELVCIKTPEASVYNLSKEILAKNSGAALKILDELFFMRIEPMIILYTVSSVYVDMYRVLSCRKGGKSISDAAKLFGYKGREFVLERAARSLSGFDFKRLTLSFDALIDADRQLKAYGGDPRIILEQLTVRLIYIAAKGERVD